MRGNTIAGFQSEPSMAGRIYRNRPEHATTVATGPGSVKGKFGTSAIELDRELGLP